MTLWSRLDAPYKGKFRFASQEQTELLIQEVLTQGLASKPVSDAKSNQAHWNKRWSNQTESCIGPGTFLRYGGRFIEVQDPKFESKWYQANMPVLFKRWFSPPMQRLYEFGCGSGINLKMLSGMYPGSHIYGFEWAMSAVAQVNQIGKNVSGERFDMLNPDYRLASGAQVLTRGSLEQLGGRFQPFLDFLLANKPAICVHIEPIIELYDPTNPVDASAMGYHQARGYLVGFLPALRELEKQGRIELLKVHRTGFGGKWHEGYSEIVWRPDSGASREF